MSTKSYSIVVSGMPVEVVRKDIKNLHLGVYPPNGRVRVAAPLRLDEDAVRGWPLRRAWGGFAGSRQGSDVRRGSPCGRWSPVRAIMCKDGASGST